MKDYLILSHTRWGQKDRQKDFTVEHSRARAYFVSTVRLDENMVRAYIRTQEEEDERYDQMKHAMWQSAKGGSRFLGAFETPIQ